MRPYSQDLRDRVLRALERGERPSHVARRFEVSRSWVHEVRRRLEAEDRRTSLPMGGHRTSVVAPVEAEIRAWLTERPDMTLAEMCERLQLEHGIAIKGPALWHQLNNWGLSYKKNAARQRARAPRHPAGETAMEGQPARARRRKAGVPG